jgi:hypothetical protein
MQSRVRYVAFLSARYDSTMLGTAPYLPCLRLGNAIAQHQPASAHCAY